jgi:tight adherence protein B
VELVDDLRRLFSHDDSGFQRQLVEAIAAWTESLRDTMAAASGLEQAIIATAQRAPKAIEGPLQRLVASLRYETLESSLRRFADDVAHPTCDFVVAALTTSARHQTRDLQTLLGHLSECARAECHLYLRIWVSRARSRTAVRIITAVVGLFVSGLFIFNRAYLEPFVSVAGVFIALMIFSTFVIALVWLSRIANVRTPDRLLRRVEALS